MLGYTSLVILSQWDSYKEPNFIQDTEPPHFVYSYWCVAWQPLFWSVDWALRTKGLAWCYSIQLIFNVWSSQCGGTDKSLARPGRKQARQHVRDAGDFNNIETRAVKFFSLQGKEPKEIHAILTETLARFLPGGAKDLSATLYIYQSEAEHFKNWDKRFEVLFLLVEWLLGKIVESVFQLQKCVRKTWVYILISDTKRFLWALRLCKTCSNVEDTAI